MVPCTFEYFDLTGENSLNCRRLSSRVPARRGHTREELALHWRLNWQISGSAPIECYQWFAREFLKRRDHPGWSAQEPRDPAQTSLLGCRAPQAQSF
jgi:hypothetical protein